MDNNFKKPQMKFTFIILLIVTLGFSQPKDQEHYIAFSVAVDLKNVMNNKPALDVLYQFSMVGQNIEVNLGYEQFKSICFEKYTVGVGYHFQLYGYVFGKEIKTVFIPSIEPTLIGRWGEEWQCSSSHLSIGGNLALRWHFSDKTAIELLSNFLPRTDLKARYSELHSKVPIIQSYFLKIIYKI